MSMQQRIRSERGAIATITAILSVALIGFAAFAIDLGNAFARKRIVQTQADLAALAGGGFLPDSTEEVTNPAVLAAYDYLVKNTVIGDDPDISFADFVDDDDANGEIRILGEGDRLGVLAPPAFVDYGLAQVFNQDGLDVQAYAEVGVFTPGRVAPFFLPFSCSDPLPDTIFIKSGSSAIEDEPEPVFLEDMVDKNQLPIVSTIDPPSVGLGAAANSRTVSDGVMLEGSAILTSATAGFSLSDVGAQVIVDGAAVRSFADGSMTAGSPILTSVNADFVESQDVGAEVVVAGAGPAGGTLTAVISAVNGPEEVVLSVDAASDVSAAVVSVTPSSGDDLTATILSWDVATPTQVTLDANASGDVSAANVTITQPSSLEVTIAGDGFIDRGDGIPSMDVAFVRGDLPQIVTVGGENVEVAVAKEADSITVLVPDEVLSTAASAWYIQIRGYDSAGDPLPWSFAESKRNEAILTVSSTANPSDKCGQRATGDFGLIDSPRFDANSAQRLGLNIAEGVDHPVDIFPDVEDRADIDVNERSNCRDITGNDPVIGGIWDDETTLADETSTPNCLGLSNGNKVDSTTDGLITGSNQPRTYSGRLDTDGPTAPCTRPNYNVLGTSINNDVLSCFLEPGDSLSGAILGQKTSKFVGEIVNSPRFLLVPVIYANANAADSDGNQLPGNPQGGSAWYPIQRFAAAFITDETTTTSATSTNGIEVNGNDVQGIVAIPFELDRLPTQISTTGAVIPYIGYGPKVVRLIK